MKQRTAWVFALKLIMVFMMLLTHTVLKAQIRYSAKSEVGYLPYVAQTIRAEHDLDWKGEALNKKQNGIEVSVVNGIRFREVLFFGVGIGYLNYEGVNGYSIYGDMEVLGSKKKLAPLFGFRAGSTHIYNQYEGGSSSGTVEFSIGVNYRPINKLHTYLKAGVRFAHSASFTPIRIGVGF